MQTSTVKTITPTLAKELLAKARPNRYVDSTRLAAYATAMQEGKWFVTHQGIALDDEGFLVDGETRLRAVVQAGVPVRMQVTTGVDPEARSAMDKGRPRRLSDELTMAGVQNATLMIAYTNAIAGLICGLRTGVRVKGEFDAWMNVFGDDIKWAVTTFATAPDMFRVAYLGAAFALAHKTAPRKVNELALQVRDGEGLKRADVAYLLRRYVIERRGEREARDVSAKKVLRAIASHLDDAVPLVRLDPAEWAFEKFMAAYDENAIAKLVDPLWSNFTTAVKTAYEVRAEKKASFAAAAKRKK